MDKNFYYFDIIDGIKEKHLLSNVGGEEINEDNKNRINIFTVPAYITDNLADKIMDCPEYESVRGRLMDLFALPYFAYKGKQDISFYKYPVAISLSNNNGEYEHKDIDVIIQFRDEQSIGYCFVIGLASDFDEENFDLIRPYKMIEAEIDGKVVKYKGALKRKFSNNVKVLNYNYIPNFHLKALESTINTTDLYHLFNIPRDILKKLVAMDKISPLSLNDILKKSSKI